MVYLHVGLLDEAMREIQKAVEINPANSIARYRIGVIRMHQGRCEEASSIFKSTTKRNASSLAHQTARALLCLGRNAEATETIDRYLKEHPEDEGGHGTSMSAILFATAGNRRQAEDTIARAMHIGEGYGHFHHTAHNIASAYAVMHRPDEAMRWLQTAVDDGFACGPCFESDPTLASLRSDPRFVRLMDASRSKGKIVQR